MPVRPEPIVPQNPVITNLNGLLADIYVRHIALRDADFEKHYRVFGSIFRRLIKEMKEGDAYFKQYSSTVSNYNILLFY